MDDPFQRLDEEFCSVEKEMGLVAQRLKAAFDAAGRSEADTDVLDDAVDPVALVARLRAMEAELPSLSKKMAKLAQDKKALVSELGQLLPATQAAVASVAQAIGVEADPAAASSLAALSALADTAVAPAPSSPTPAAGVAPVPRAAAGAGGGAGAGGKASATGRAPPASPSRRSGGRQAASPRLARTRPRLSRSQSDSSAVAAGRGAKKAGGRRGAAEGRKVRKKKKREAVEPLTLTEDMFADVPSIVKGRCKFRDVVKVYEMVCDHAREALDTMRSEYSGSHGRAPRPSVAALGPVTIKELNAKGGKVIGLTGTCVLKSLRHMGAIKLGRDGVTFVQPQPAEEEMPTETA